MSNTLISCQFQKENEIVLCESHNIVKIFIEQLQLTGTDSIKTFHYII
jgi:hypothetical protein